MPIKGARYRHVIGLYQALCRTFVEAAKLNLSNKKRSLNMFAALPIHLTKTTLQSQRVSRVKRHGANGTSASDTP